MKSNPFTRRKFLKGALATAGGLALPTFIPGRALGLDGHVSPSNRIVMGCIGWGQISPADVGELIKHPEIQYVAACEVDRPRLDACAQYIEDYYSTNGGAGGAWKGVTKHHDFREMVARPDIDAINIGVPDHWHGLMTIAAAKAGKDIYCQKPLSLTIEEGKAMVAAVRRYGRVLQTGSQSRSIEAIRHACELVLNGRLGKLTGVKVGLPQTPYMPMDAEMPIPDGFDYEMWLGPAPWAPYTAKRCHISYRWILDYSDGMVADWGAHQIDIAQWGMGRMLSGPVEIEGSGKFPRDGLSTAATEFSFTCTYEDGVQMEVSTSLPGGVTWEGPGGTISCGHGGWSNSDPATLLTSKIGPNEKKLYPGSPEHHRNFIDCVLTREEPNAPVEVGHRTATVCHMANIAMLLGRKLQWDPVAEHFVNDDEANRMMSRPMRQPWALS